MKPWRRSRRFVWLVASGSWLALLGSCPLTDQQITGIAQSAITTGLNAVVSNFISSLLATGDAAAG